MFDFLTELIADIVDVFLDFWVNKVAAKFKRKNKL